jgi:hypothetical protein
MISLGHLNGLSISPDCSMGQLLRAADLYCRNASLGASSTIVHSSFNNHANSFLYPIKYALSLLVTCRNGGEYS